jgi:plasmid replication initiation protein
MARLRHCGYCGAWFRPHPKTVDRQQVCGNAACQRQRHKKACCDWRKKNPHYDKQDRLVATLVTRGPVSRADPMSAINWEAARDKVGPEIAVLVEETGKAICQWAREDKPA